MDPTNRTVKEPMTPLVRATRARLELMKRMIKDPSNDTEHPVTVNKEPENPMDRAAKARMDLLKRFAIGTVSPVLDPPESEAKLAKDAARIEAKAIYVDPIELLVEDQIDLSELHRNKRPLHLSERATKSQVDAVNRAVEDQTIKKERRSKKSTHQSDRPDKLHGAGKGRFEPVEHASKARDKRGSKARADSFADSSEDEEMSSMERRMKEIVNSIERAAKANVDAMENGMPEEIRANDRRFRWPMNSEERLSKDGMGRGLDKPTRSMERMAKSFVDSMERSINESKALLDPMERLAKEPLNPVEQMITWNSQLKGL